MKYQFGQSFYQKKKVNQKQEIPLNFNIDDVSGGYHKFYLKQKYLFDDKEQICEIESKIVELPTISPISDTMWKEMRYRCRTIRVQSNDNVVQNDNVMSRLSLVKTGAVPSIITE